ncbi:hypothetical protein WH8501_22705 [Crocosphaera watsonii WH 8501]|uniref:hypothetical protein n=1 Tax=Crocosphaera watsonii TaxID=263511 RepID=UPI0018DDDF6B|nr:hypothetical protein [Crocosphaera watsonii]
MASHESFCKNLVDYFRQAALAPNQSPSSESTATAAPGTSGGLLLSRASLRVVIALSGKVIGVFSSEFKSIMVNVLD